MKHLCLIIMVSLMAFVTGCAGAKHTVSNAHVNQKKHPTAHGNPVYVKLERAQQTVSLALEYFDQGGYEKSADLFLDAADLYKELNLKSEERKVLIALVKAQLKCSKQKAFLLTMARFKGLLSDLELPSEEERFFINLSDHMKQKALTYPVLSSWQIVFK